MAVRTTAAKMARVFAVVQIITGVLLFGFGIADRRVKGGTYFEWTGYFYFGIWIGVWTGITGSLGIPSSGRERTSSHNSFAGVFMCFSITSAVLGALIIISYSIGLFQLTDDDHRYYYTYYHYTKLGRSDNYWDSYNYRGKLAIISIMLILGIVTFGIGILAAICTFLMKPCTCCSKQPQQGGVVTVPGGHPLTVDLPPEGVVQEAGPPPPYQIPTTGGLSSGAETRSVMHVTGQGGQGPDGVPVPFPVQQAENVVTVPGDHPQMVHLPPEGVIHETGPPPPYQISTTGVHSSGAEADPPPPYSKDRQLPVKTYV